MAALRAVLAARKISLLNDVLLQSCESPVVAVSPMRAPMPV